MKAYHAYRMVKPDGVRIGVDRTLASIVCSLAADSIGIVTSVSFGVVYAANPGEAIERVECGNWHPDMEYK